MGQFLACRIALVQGDLKVTCSQKFEYIATQNRPGAAQEALLYLIEAADL